MANGDSPGVCFETQVQDDLGDDGIYGTVEDPAFDSKGEDREGEVGIVTEEDVGDQTI